MNGQDEVRTHDRHSAIDDEPRTVTKAEDLPPAGMDAIPADMPNSDHSDMPLEYTLQNFNALVSANTAMTTEISSFAEKEAQWRELVEAKDAQILSEKTTRDLQQKHAEEARVRHQAIKSERDELRDELTFVTAQRDTLQRRLDRSLGYLDRVIDTEDEFGGAQTETRTLPKPAVGPAIGEIPDPVRPRRDQDGERWIEAARIARFDDRPARHRRF